MKNFKRISLLLLTVVCFFFDGTSRVVTNSPVVNKIVARKVIRRTAMAIIIAHKKVKENKIFTGDLAKAIAHQKFSRSLYRRGFYLRAIHHSRMARLYALKAIKANKGSDVEEAKFTAEEEQLMKEMPSESDLTNELLKEKPDYIMKDEDIINKSPDVDLDSKE